MQTSKLRTFATEARKILMMGVKQRLQTLGFDDDGEPREMPEKHDGGATFQGRILSIDFYEKWMKLREAIQRHTLRNVAEEAAYTWFNRLVCIRILVRNHLAAPVLEYEADGSRLPMLVADARQGRLPDIADEATKLKLDELLRDDRQTAEQFRLLITAYCHANPIINACFGQMSDYTELLLPQNILAEGGFVDMLNHDDYITLDDYRSSELIGWLYQFYISDRKDEVFAKKDKYTAEEIPAATQIFTPNWIVKYMVNGAMEPLFAADYDLENIKVADLACGSGHIIGECFELLYKMYMEDGYSRRQAIEGIFRDNLLGIDLDTRAKQLAQFALLLKACQKDESFAEAHLLPRVLDMPSPLTMGDDELQAACLQFVGGYESAAAEWLKDYIDDMKDADTLGSIMDLDMESDVRDFFKAKYEEWMAMDSADVPADVRQLLPYVELMLALSDKFDALVMNPPYMGSGNMNATLSDYVKTHYPEGKGDLFAVFMQVCENRLKEGGRYAMINMQSWMFLSSFESLRRHVVSDLTIESMLHLGPRTFDELSGEVVQNTAFVIRKQEPTPDASATYYRLVDGKDCADKERMYLSATTDGNKIYYPNVPQKNFEKIPGCVVGYWASEKMIDLFDNDVISKYGISDGQNITGDNDKYIRFIWEVSKSISGKNLKWVPMAKGGSFRRWYGNILECVNWSKEARDEYKTNKIARIQDPYLWYRIGITWNLVSGCGTGFRLLTDDVLFNKAAPTIVLKEENLSECNYILGFLNTKITKKLLSLMNPTLNTNIAEVFNLPLIEYQKGDIDTLVEENISISKSDWDAHETSWDFERSPLLERMDDCGANVADLDMLDPEEAAEIKRDYDVPTNPHLLSDVVAAYKHHWERQFRRLHANEEELNRQFIAIYGLEDELSPDVPLKEVTILQQGEIDIANNL